MTYLIPTIGKLILLVYCASLVIQTLSRLGFISDLVTNLSTADAELMACAQRKANLLNIDDSYEYMRLKFPKFIEQLKSTKETLQSVIETHNNSCTHPIFTSIHASAHYQVNPNYPNDWPNWIIGIEEHAK